MRLTTLRVEAGFFVFYSVLGFCFICVPVEVIGTALRVGTDTLIFSVFALTIGSATLLRIQTHEVVIQEVKREVQVIPLEEWREFQESLK